jgi:hypothetical protein
MKSKRIAKTSWTAVKMSVPMYVSILAFALSRVPVAPAGLCRMAAQAPDGTDFPLVNLVRPDTTPTDGTAEQTSSTGNHISWSQAICPGWLIIVLPSTRVVGRKYFHECMYKAPVKTGSPSLSFLKSNVHLRSTFCSHNYG